MDTTTINRAKEVIKQIPIPSSQWAVSSEEHNSELDSLKEIIHYEKFFFIFDTINFRIENLAGVSKWLGYDESTFTYQKYLSLIHPSFMEALIHLAKITYEIANNKNFEVEFRQHQYVVNIAIKHSKGHYLLCKRALSAWQWQHDENSQVITHFCNEFTVVEEIDEIAPETRPRVLDKFHNKIEELEKQLRTNSSSATEGKSISFTCQELRVLRKLAYNPSIKAKEIAKAFNIDVTTVHTHNKLLLEKGRLFFHDEGISSAKEVATLLRRNFLV
jgi:predicted DNA-binding transcriptional regulator